MAAILATKLLDTTSQSGFKAITTCILSLDYVGTNKLCVDPYSHPKGSGGEHNILYCLLVI